MAMERMDLPELVRKEAADADLDSLREGLRVLMQAVMEAEVVRKTVPKQTTTLAKFVSDTSGRTGTGALRSDATGKARTVRDRTTPLPRDAPPREAAPPGGYAQSQSRSENASSRWKFAMLSRTLRMRHRSFPPFLTPRSPLPIIWK